jgi:hypothetical protein
MSNITTDQMNENNKGPKGYGQLCPFFIKKKKKKDPILRLHISVIRITLFPQVV